MVKRGLKLVGVLPLLLQAPVLFAADSATWKLSSSTDELTDSRITTAVIGDRDGRPSTALLARCSNKRFEIITTFGAYLGNDPRPIKFRLDQGELQEAKWMPSSKGTAVFAADANSLARQLLSSTKIILEVTDFRGTSYRSAYAWPANSSQLRTVMNECAVTPVGLEESVPGLRKDVAREAERWGPKNIITKKRALAATSGFTGPINTEMTAEFALAAQAALDAYIEGCKKGSLDGVHCASMKIFWKANAAPVLPLAGSVIYEQAPKDLQAEMGDLKISD